MKNTRRGLGKGLGMGYKNIAPMDSHIHSLSAKGVKSQNKPFDYMRAVIRFEDMNPDYPSSQMEGVKVETLEREFQDPRYIDEKVENTKRFYNEILDNFGHRIKDPEIQKEFKERLEAGKLDAKGKSLYAIGSLHTFNLSPDFKYKDYTIVTYFEGTRNGFRHMASLMKNGREVAKAKATYLNRTWESYEFQTVIHDLIRNNFPKTESEQLIKDFDKNRGI